MRHAILYTRPLPDYLLALLAQKVPAYGMPLVQRLVRSYDFGFRFARSRRSKLGDFTRSASGAVTITINTDLPDELFLITFLHEVAHHEATLGRPRREVPHGRRWQNCYGELLKDLCRDAEGHMAVPLRDALLAHSVAPTATLHADHRLAALLLPAIPVEGVATEGTSIVEALAAGSYFTYRGRTFLLGGKLSKRHYATDLKTGKLFSFSGQCRVQLMPERTTNARLLLGSQLELGQEFIHRSRRFRLESRMRTRLRCLDLATGRLIDLHGLMHVAV